MVQELKKNSIKRFAIEEFYGHMISNIENI